jgi:hypothetical protein
MLGSRRTIVLGPSDALIPWCQCRPFAKTARFLAPWMGRGPGDQTRWSVEVPSIQGGCPGQSGLAGWVPRFQGHAVASGPIRHEGPDILVEMLPGYQAGRGTRMNEAAWDPGAAYTSITEAPSPSRALEGQFPGGSSRSVRRGRLGPSLPEASWCRGAKVIVGRWSHLPSIVMAPWPPRGTQWLDIEVLHRARCIELLGRPVNWVSCHLGPIGAMGPLAPR